MWAVKPQAGSPLAVGARRAAVDRLLARYADTSGCITEGVLAGVIELCGLPDEEAQLTRLRATVLPDDLGHFREPVAAALRLMDDDRHRNHLDRRLLTAAEEIGLSVLLRGGPEFAEVEPDKHELPNLPANDIRRRARDALVLHNQKLVHSIMRSYLQESPALGYEDLAQEGMLGLMRAARKFSPTSGYKFSTYATVWVRQFIERALKDQSRTIRIPIHAFEDLVKLRRVERRLRAESREPDIAEVAAACGWSVDKVKNVRRDDWTVVSMDKVVNEDTPFGELIGEYFALPGADVPVIDAAETERIRNLINLFPTRDAAVLAANLGLFDGEEVTLETLGQVFGVTRERIRQIRIKALKRLRHAYRDSTGDLHAALRHEIANPTKDIPDLEPKEGKKADVPSRRTHRVPAKAVDRSRRRRGGSPRRAA
ncbi:sigma-70 family RNA polymerase sigma factor [Glycomyces rhizosphaerae]|uniref:RNA polymerase sigma factor RpoD/SigA n=1 Tax=Glycomyces rhizosphaerae TaxID=2054422 RepID=A0ABV7Q494_9ACTN